MSVIDKYYNETIGKWIEMDGVPVGDPYQCADYFKHACKRNLGYHWPAGGDGYVDNWWYNRQAHANEFIFITDYTKLKNGDFVIWAHGSRNRNSVFPLSHIAMYYNGFMVGANQNGHKEITAVAVNSTVWANMIGAFRFREWKGEDVKFVNGLQKYVYGNATYHVYRGYGGMELRMLSALGGDHATQDITAYDHNNLTIYAMANCNYFQMNSNDYGQHYGVELSDGDNVHTQANQYLPPNEKYIAYFERGDGTVDYVRANEFYDTNLVFACSPYSVRIHKGEDLNDISTAFTNKEDYATNQTAYFKLPDGNWCIAVSESKVTPNQMVEALKAAVDIQELFFVDGGGSSQLWAWNGTEMEKALYTGRAIPNVLCLAKDRPIIVKPPVEEPEPVMPTPEPDPEPVVQEPVVEEPKEDEKPTDEPVTAPDKPIEEITDEATKDGYLFKMSDKTYDFLRIFTAFIIPLLIREYPRFAEIWGWGYSTQVIDTLSELSTIISAILYVSSVGYAKKKNGGGK